tara:strand:- start:214 stop:696 length:483 start_codon:yes stop_codon:yes gene_type:complete
VPQFQSRSGPGNGAGPQSKTTPGELFRFTQKPNDAVSQVNYDRGIPPLMQKLAPLVLTLFLAAILGGCAFPGVYKIDIQQGNIVKQEDLDKLSSGMTRDDVHQTLGTPMTQNTFRDDRDYYLYTFQDSGGQILKQRVTVFYNGDQYARHTARLLDETPAY